MSDLRMRRNASEVEFNIKTKLIENETVINGLKQLLDISRNREKKLVAALERHGIEVSLDIEAGTSSLFTGDISVEIEHDDSKLSFTHALFDRGIWLIGLMLFQSFSSIILSSNEKLLNKHPSIIFFLTMLVGSGGNAGGSSCVRVIRGLGNNTLKSSPQLKSFLLRELCMAFALSLMLGCVGLLRSSLTSNITYHEILAITTSLVVIVFLSIGMGATLPLILYYFKLDPAHASGAIQVVMDISGVLITCVVCSIILDYNNDSS